MRLLLMSIVCIATYFGAFGQSDWSIDYSPSKDFIENKGQYDEFENEFTGPIQYAVDFGETKILFGLKGVSYQFKEISKKSKKERQEIMSSKSNSLEDHKKKEQLHGKFMVKTDAVNFSWNANESCSIEGIGQASDYHSYTITDNEGNWKNINHVNGFKKIIYKNIYDGIDVEYQVHPQIGVKYAFIIHPGANINDIQMDFDRDVSIINKEIHIKTAFGDIIDHAPITFYENQKDILISSAFVAKNKTVKFNVGKYDKRKTIVIDPWVQTPDFNLNWDIVWELDYDAAGNTYAIGGVMPLELLKYDPTGNLVWTYSTPYDTTEWLGTMATDDLGNTYVTNGTDPRMLKVDAGGNLLFYNPTPANAQISTELWNISFNCDQTRLIVGGSGGNLDIHGRIYDVNMTNGDLISSVQVTDAGDLFGIPPQIQEVRAMCAAPNGKYYFVTLDTIGYLNENLDLCPTGSSSLVRDDHAVNWGYKSENWRYSNTGIKVIRANENFVYVHKGNELQQRSLVDFSVINSVTIPNGVLDTPFLSDNVSNNAGIDLDDCGNIYVGSTDGVYGFNAALTQIGFYPTSFNVYDVRVNVNGEVVACGGNGDSGDSNRSGGIQSFAAGACSVVQFTCCDATVCTPEEMCEADGPISLVTAQSGGTWSGTGVDASGNFDPAVAGSGVHQIMYTLPCGSETISITVNPCTTLEVCIDGSGNLTVSQGDGNYTWSEGTISNVNTPINTEQECIDCPGATPQYVPIIGIYQGCDIATCSTTDTTWNSVGTGATLNSGYNLPLLVEDGNGVTLLIEDVSGLVACSNDPCDGVTISSSIVSQQDPNCFGGTDGAAEVSATGGDGSYNYVWTPGNMTGGTQNTLSAQDYLVTVQDGNGCQGTVTVSISEPSEIVIDLTPSNASCGQNNGSITAVVSGGAGNYDFLWSPSGSTDANATNLSAGSHTLTVTDGNLCVEDETAIVGEDGGPAISLDSSADALCFGSSDGQATVSATGGNGGNTFTWSPGGMTGTSQTTLSAGSYDVTVEDQLGCIDVVNVVIDEPTEIQLSEGAMTQASCGANDGSAEVIASGGAGGYTYAWSPTGGNASVANNIGGGVYNVVVTDANACTADIDISVTTLNGPVISVDASTDASCFGSSDGTATVSVSGGTSPYVYTWSPTGGSAATAVGLSAGQYTVTVEDNGGCISSEQVVIMEPSAIVIDETIVDENCIAADGSIAVVASGGAGSYSYDWTPNNETTDNISGLSAGSYGVTVTDGNGCSSQESYTVLSVGGIVIDASPEVSVIEAGESVQLTATGGDTYVWTPAEGLSCTDCSSPIASPSQSTSYIVIGTDANGCTGADTVYVQVDQACGNLFVPNAFSPNGDGLNETLCVMGGCISELSFSIYNRWGQMIFDTDTQSQCWNGEYKGKLVMADVYAYKLFVRLNDGTVVEESGNINVVR